MSITNLRLRQLEKEHTIVKVAAGLTVTRGQILASAEDGYVLADCSSLETIQGTVIAADNQIGDEVVAITSGMQDITGGKEGQNVYIGKQGAYTTTAPSVAGEWIKCIGTVINAFQWRFEPDAVAVMNSDNVETWIETVLNEKITQAEQDLNDLSGAVGAVRTEILALDDKINDSDLIRTSEKGVANGVATLGENGLVPTTQLPEFASSLNKLSDVDLTVPATSGQALVYDNTSGKFKAGTVAMGSEIYVGSGDLPAEDKLKINPSASGVPFSPVYKFSASLPAAGWNALTQTITVNGIKTDNLVMVDPVTAGTEDYGIECTAQGANSLTFTCTTKPDINIDMNVIIIDNLQTSLVGSSAPFLSVRGDDGTICDFAGLQGATGPAGADGATGADGAKGDLGPGIAAGGTVGQILTKKSATDFETEWTTNPSYTKAEVDTLVGSGSPTKTSQLTNDSGFVVDAAYVHTDNNYDSATKAKVDAMPDRGGVSDSSLDELLGLVVNEETEHTWTLDEIIGETYRDAAIPTQEQLDASITSFTNLMNNAVTNCNSALTSTQTLKAQCKDYYDLMSAIDHTIVYATKAEAEEGTLDNVAMSPLRTSQLVDAKSSLPIEKVQSLGTLTANTLIDCSCGNIATATIGASLSLSFAAHAYVPYCRVLTLILTNGGAYTLTWGSTIKWDGGVVPALTIAGVDILHFMTIDNGATWYGCLGGKGFV